MRLSLLAALVLTLPGSITLADDLSPVAADVPYYGDAPPDDYAAERCKLDVYRPEGVEGYPTVVFFHGGGLRNGNRHIGDPFAERFVAEGVGVVLVDYRLSPRAACPSYIEDAAAAVAWTLDHIKEHGGNPDAVFVSGHSAGGYLTAMVGLDPSYLARHDHSPDELAGLLPLAGQMITHSTVRAERDLPEDRPLIDAFAPCHHVRPDAPPILCLAGANDLPARAEENVYFTAAMKAVGQDDIRCVIVPMRNHITLYTQTFNQGDEVAEAMLDFIRERASER